MHLTIDFHGKHKAFHYLARRRSEFSLSLSKHQNRTRHTFLRSVENLRNSVSRRFFTSKHAYFPTIAKHHGFHNSPATVVVLRFRLMHTHFEMLQFIFEFFINTAYKIVYTSIQCTLNIAQPQKYTIQKIANNRTYTHY